MLVLLELSLVVLLKALSQDLYIFFINHSISILNSKVVWCFHGKKRHCWKCMKARWISMMSPTNVLWNHINLWFQRCMLMLKKTTLLMKAWTSLTWNWLCGYMPSCHFWIMCIHWSSSPNFIICSFGALSSLQLSLY